MLLEKHLDLAVRAHNGISFSPERRGAQYINDYSAELAADIEAITNAAAKYAADPAAQIERYTANYEKAFTAWMHTKSNCLSSMIAGPSNFPTRRAEKANRAEHNKYEVFRTWRAKALKAIAKSFMPPITVDSELQRYRDELRTLEEMQERMKKCNAIIRDAAGKDCTAELIAAGISEKTARKIQIPDQLHGLGFARYQLSNNNANIRRIRERIEVMERKAANIESGEVPTYNFEGGQVVLNHEADRVQILYDEKPAPEIITKLKRGGFRWSPSQKAWQRQLTRAGKDAAERMTGLKIK
ncbi:MAG: hypothetical protein EOP50_00135 [Sphingobacteriales bacterium]|nr:MAG: hypothetical protein EOP50_00135 [Sphingobacteriales bacterium]